MNRPADVPSEAVLRRVRIPMIRRAQLSFDGVARDVFVVDIGLAGVFVEHPEKLPLGTQASLTFRLPGNDIAIEAVCRVAWWRGEGTPGDSRKLPAGAGLEFMDVSDADRARIRDYVADYMRRDVGARRFVRHASDDGEGEA